MGATVGGLKGGTSQQLAVVRPPIPIHVGALLALALGVAIGYSGTLGVDARWPVAVTLTAVLGGLALNEGVTVRPRFARTRYRAAHRMARPLMLMVAVTLLGILIGSLDGAQWQRDRSRLGDLPYGGISLTVREGSSETAFGQRRAYAEVDLGRGHGAVVEVVHGEELDLRFGQRVAVAGRCAPVRTPRATDLAKGLVGRVTVSKRAAAFVRTSWQDGIVGTLAQIRQRLLVAIDGLPVDEEGRALLAGLLLGERSAVRDAGLEEPFRAAGVSHILSVSGSHLAVVAGAVMVASRAGGVGRAGASVAVVLFAMLFTVLTGGEAATLRAWCMLLVAALVHHGGRRADGLAAVGVAGCGLVLTDSGLVFSVGFWLSIGAVVGLVLFTRYLGRWISEVSNGSRLGRALSIPLAATAAAQLSTTPVASVVFGALSLVAPLANLIVVPLTSIAIVVGLVGAAFHQIGMAGTVPLAVAATVSEWAVRATAVLASVPGAEVTLGSTRIRWLVAILAACTMLGLYLGWPAPRSIWRLLGVHPRALGRSRSLRGGRWVGSTALGTAGGFASAVLVAALWFAPSLGLGSRVVFLDVGQGDATLIQSGGRSVLVDGGPSESTLRWELLMAGCLRVDEVIATHDHDDHVGGLTALKDQLGGPPGVVYCAAGAERSGVLTELALSYSASVSPLATGGTVRIGNLVARVIGPSAEVVDPGANESCLVLVVQRRRGSAVASSRSGVLIGGDAEAASTLTAVRNAGLEGISVVKVGHHGSDEAVSPTLLGVIDPELAVISVGEDNRYGHPTEGTLDTLNDAGVPFRRTDRDGRVAIRF